MEASKDVLCIKLVIINIINEIIMSRKIVLKSVFAVAVLGFVLVFSSCKKDDPKDDPKNEPKEEPKKEHAIVGTWMYEKVKIVDPMQEIMLNTFLPMMGIDKTFNELFEERFGGTYEFTKDGKVLYQTTEGNYEINDNKLTIDIGISGTFDFSIVDKTMYWDIDLVEMLSEFGIEDANTYLATLGITKIDVRVTLKKQ